MYRHHYHLRMHVSLGAIPRSCEEVFDEVDCQKPWYRFEDGDCKWYTFNSIKECCGGNVYGHGREVNRVTT